MLTTEKKVATEDVLRKIRNLLARQNHATANEHEAKVCADKVQALLLKHDLAMADITGEEVEEGMAQEHIPMGVNPGASYDWCLHLGAAVARACFCRQMSYVKDRIILFVGNKTDATVAKELYQFLAGQVQRLMIDEAYAPPPIDARGKIWNKEFKLHGFKFWVPQGWWPEHTRRLSADIDAGQWCRGFLQGCAFRVAERLDEDTQKARWAENAAKVNALVRVKSDAVNRYVADTWPKAKPAPTSKQAYLEDGVLAGYQAGDKVRLKKAERLGEGGRPLPQRRANDAAA